MYIQEVNFKYLLHRSILYLVHVKKFDLHNILYKYFNFNNVF